MCGLEQSVLRTSCLSDRVPSLALLRESGPVRRWQAGRGIQEVALEGHSVSGDSSILHTTLGYE